MTLSQNPRLSAAKLLSESENFNDPSATWHISRQQMAKTSLGLTFVIGSVTGDVFKTSTGKYISIEHYRSKGHWIQKALENQLQLNSTQAQRLAILMERSALRAAGFSEQEWQEYYEKRNNLHPGDTSWAITSQETREIISFLKEGIIINEEYCVPYYAGLSDDKKTIYFDSSTDKSTATSLGHDISFRDYVILHERVEGAMMEQSYFDQLKSGKDQIIFEAPLTVKEENHFEKLVMRYRLVDDELKLSYELKLCSSKKEWEGIQGMDQQAIEQHVLSYEFAHQIAERLERVAIFAEYGNIWANEYNKPLMKEIERLMNEYRKLYEANASLTRPIPPNLYILPYAQETDNKIEMYLLRQVADPKLKKYASQKPPLSQMFESSKKVNAPKPIYYSDSPTMKGKK